MDHYLVILLSIGIFIILLCLLLTYFYVCAKYATDFYKTRARVELVPDVPDRHVIVQISEEKVDSKPPAYSNFGPPSYEEAFELDQF